MRLLPTDELTSSASAGEAPSNLTSSVSAGGAFCDKCHGQQFWLLAVVYVRPSKLSGSVSAVGPYDDGGGGQQIRLLAMVGRSCCWLWLMVLPAS